jgi:hypothetical protein
MKSKVNTALPRTPSTTWATVSRDLIDWTNELPDLYVSPRSPAFSLRKQSNNMTLIENHRVWNVAEDPRNDLWLRVTFILAGIILAVVMDGTR